MLAIYKKELKSYFTSMIGYIVSAAILLAVGIYFTYYNLAMGAPSVGYALSGGSIVIMIVIPILTMRTLADERRNKTDQLLLTAPVTIGKMVIGKYLAMLTVVLLPLAIISIYPLLLSGFGEVQYSVSYGSILGYFLLFAASIAVGMFLSSITESQVISAVLTFGVLFLGFLMGGLSSIIPTTSNFSFIAFAVLIVFVVFLLYYMTQNLVVSLIAGIAGEAAVFLIYFLKPVWLEGTFNKVLAAFDIMSPFESFIGGTLSLPAIVYYLSVSGLFIFFAYQSIEKRRWS